MSAFKQIILTVLPGFHTFLFHPHFLLRITLPFLFPLSLRGLARAPPPRKQRHNQILPLLPVHRGHAVKMTLFITVHKQWLPRRPREISHKL